MSIEDEKPRLEDIFGPKGQSVPESETAAPAEEPQAAPDAAAPETPESIAESVAEPAQESEAVTASVDGVAVGEGQDPAPAEGQPAEAVEEVSGELSWYIIQTLSGQEDKVRSNILKQIEELGLKDKVTRVLLPEEETVEIKGGKRIEKMHKMYPGYLFVEMVMDQDVWYMIRQTVGVARFIGDKAQPIPVADREMQRVLKQIGIKEEKIEVAFEKGEAIRVISGPFRGYSGTVQEINVARNKLKTFINIFGRDTPVEVDFDQAEKGF